jgi:hypothetical protein
MDKGGTLLAGIALGAAGSGGIAAAIKGVGKKPNPGTRPGGADNEAGLPNSTMNPEVSPFNHDNVSTATPSQVTAPRDLNEQIVWNNVLDNPSMGRDTRLEGDPRFPRQDGWQKMEAVHYLPDNSTVTIHYQYNSNTGKAYDMKITTPEPSPVQPGVTIKGENP